MIRLDVTSPSFYPGVAAPNDRAKLLRQHLRTESAIRQKTNQRVRKSSKRKKRRKRVQKKSANSRCPSTRVPKATRPGVRKKSSKFLVERFGTKFLVPFYSVSIFHFHFRCVQGRRSKNRASKKIVQQKEAKIRCPSLSPKNEKARSKKKTSKRLEINKMSHSTFRYKISCFILFRVDLLFTYRERVGKNTACTAISGRLRCISKKKTKKRKKKTHKRNKNNKHSRFSLVITIQ